MRHSEKRNSILQTADHLFQSQGFNGTGVDQIASESGVTKRTLYKHFGSKEGLIREVLIAHHKRMMKHVRSAICDVEGGPRERLLACFELYREWFGRSNFSGCIFIKTFNEFAGCSTELGQIAQNAKNGMRAFIAELAEDGHADEPEQLALQLQLLLEGSIVLAQGGNGPSVIDTSQAVGRQLIDEAIN